MMSGRMSYRFAFLLRVRKHCLCPGSSIGYGICVFICCTAIEAVNLAFLFIQGASLALSPIRFPP